MALVPGLGPITALGLLGAAILGAAGATIGAAAGGKAEKSTYEGLPEDEIFVYEDALRKGRSVVIALARRRALGFASSRPAETERERSRWTQPASSGGSACGAPKKTAIQNPAEVRR